VIKRRKTRQINIGGVKIGGGAPISIQSMTKVSTADVKAVVLQTKRLEQAGCEIVRFAVKNLEDARAIRAIKQKIRIPVVADIHFNYRLALESIKSGADKIRLNPGNIRKHDEISAVVKAAKIARIPIRIGVNSGSVLTGEERTKGIHRRGTSPESSRNRVIDNLVSSAGSYIKLFESLDFHDIIISLKASDVVSTVEAYRRMSGVCDYPLHLGVTAAGSSDSGVVKSAIGIGALLLSGIGDTIRVSLTADPVEEVVAAKRILEAVGARCFGPEIISCPTCGRCQVDLGAIVRNLERKLYAIRYTLNAKHPLSIAVMGCEVNGPGEACEADIGIAFGKDSGILFRQGKVLKKISSKNAVRELLKLI
jgi:(E)-4-hydroxy-3-methylbut-2-enyl-diphosphate synthase